MFVSRRYRHLLPDLQAAPPHIVWCAVVRDAHHCTPHNMRRTPAAWAVHREWKLYTLWVLRMWIRGSFPLAMI